MSSSTTSSEFAVAPDPAFEATLRAVETLGYAADEVDAAARRVRYTTGLSIWSWAGQEMSVTVTGDPAGPSTVEVGWRGRGFQLVRWGEGKRLAGRLLAEVGRQLGRPGAAAG